ncbi:DUF4367 domain-containing protein [Paenibacillus azoreducens]|uniref:DUF4367 domain-containing protein n=1 Tax=Paenibacillus azoreducens TaxID=116718 RepID=A0A920CS94_9BACL|nr:DUF4367 domain-containing protein [Paenibacillus azoreducens]GIO47203.1 hypothetical protein J34TS1_19680 [Paenibacillus azoreducens]
MRKLQAFNEDESLKEMANRQTETMMQNFDVVDKVMERISQSGNRQQRAAKPRFRPGVGLTAMIVFIVLSASVTAYAASQYIEIKNSKGETILQTSKRDGTELDYDKNKAKRLDVYRKRVMDQLKPGEFAAYYVNDDVINNGNELDPIHIDYKPVEYKGFDDFQDDMKRTRSPLAQLIKEPVQVPEGYHFYKGSVQPAFPTYDEREKLKDELIDQAKSATNGDKLSVKILKWSKSDYSWIQYRNGEDTIQISASAMPEGSTGYKSTIYHNEQDLVEKIQIKGIDAYYIKAGERKKDEFYIPNRLGWVDEARRTSYDIHDNETSKLTKEDMVKIAESLISAH